MHHFFRFCPLLFLLASGIASAKGFSIDASPATQSVNAGQTATFTVTVVPVDGFDASVFLRVASSTLNSANIELEPAKLDLGTYTPGATLTVSPTKIDVGAHEIVIEGRNGGVLTYDTVMLMVLPAPGDNQWTVYHMANSGLPSLMIHALAFDTSGVAWIGTQSGLARAEVGEEPEFVNSPFGTRRIIALAVDSSNTLWVLGADSILQGLNKLGCYRNGEWAEFSVGQYSNDINLPTTVMATTPDGSVWFGGEGLLRFKDSIWTRYQTYNWGGGMSRIHSLAVSSQGDLWGVSDWTSSIDNRYSTVFKYDGDFWTGYKVADLGLPENINWGFAAAVDSNRIWILTGMTIASPRGSGVLNRSIPPDAKWLAGARNGRLWTGSYAGEGGPMLYRSEGNGWKSYPLDSSGIGRDARISKVVVHRNGSVWVGTSHGLAILWAGNDTGAVGGGTSSVSVVDRSILAAQVGVTPNPLGSHGNLSLATKGGAARITLHDNLGREVMTLFDGVLASGQQTLPIELSSVPAGVYQISVAVEGSSPSSRMIVVSR